jgi:glycosyltransferase involved in cell wall biosynthesis
MVEMMRMPPRVLIVTSRLDVGGTERHLARILPPLRRRGIDIALYVMERGGALEAGLIAQGIRVEGPKRERFLHWPRATLALARFIRRERPAILHFFLPRPYVCGSIAAALAGPSCRLMSRRSLTDYQERYPLLGVVERFLHRRTFGLIGNSRAVVDQLAREIDDQRKLALIYNGIELTAPAATQRRERMRETLQVSIDTLAICVVANLVAYKGHQDLIEALAEIKNDLPIQWRLLIIGRDDGIRGELERRAQALGIGAKIMWIGERSDVGDLLAASDLFVLPSHQEGFSNALLEAMGAGLAVVATAVGGNVDAVVDEVTGLLVRPREPRSLAAAVLRLAKDPGLRRRFGDAARQRVERYFSLDACVGSYEKLYRALDAPEPRPVAEILAENSAAFVASSTVP